MLSGTALQKKCGACGKRWALLAMPDAFCTLSPCTLIEPWITCITNNVLRQPCGKHRAICAPPQGTCIQGMPAGSTAQGNTDCAHAGGTLCMAGCMVPQGTMHVGRAEEDGL